MRLVPGDGLKLWPSLALPMTMRVCAWISIKVNFLQREFSKISVPTSSRVAVNPCDAATPPTCTTLASPDGRAEPVNAVPTDTFSMRISRTGVEPRSILRVLSPSWYSVGTSRGAKYVPESPAENDLPSITSAATTVPPTALPAINIETAIFGDTPIILKAE